MTAIHHTRIRPATILVALALAVGAWPALAGSAEAAGQITYDGCLANDASQGCFDLPFDPLGGASGVAVSPDGKSVYTSSFLSDSVAHLFRGGPDGQISYDGCLANDASQGCFDLPFELGGASGVAVSPDGKSVYVTSTEGDSVAHFFRGGPDGQISYDGCVANDASQGCADIPGSGAPLDGASAVAVSPDGKSVYVASAPSDSVAHFFRSTVGGQISYDSCVANDASQGCADLPAAPLSVARRVAVSPDSKSVYVASFDSSSVAHFFRAVDPPPDPDPDPDPEPQPAPDPGPQPNPGPGADTSPPETTIVSGPKRRTARRTARFRFRASEPGVRFQCKLDRRRWKPCSSPRTLKRLRVGRHRFSVRAIDAAGNVDPTPAKRRWRVVR